MGNGLTIAELETTLDGFFAACVDYKKRTMTLKDGKTAFLCDFKDLTDRRYIAERIVLPLLTADRVDDLERVVQTTAVKAETDLAKLREGLLFGNTLVALEGEGVFQIVLCATDEDGGRDIQEPNSDVTLRGRARDLPRTTRKTSRPSGASSAMRRWRSRNSSSASRRPPASFWRTSTGWPTRASWTACGKSWRA